MAVLPAVLVWWIRRHVPEPEEWHAAKRQASHHEPRALDLFRGSVRRTTLRTVVVCACSLTAWWAFLFWNSQHLRNLPELADWPPERRDRFVSAAFFLVIAVSIGGNFFARSSIT